MSAPKRRQATAKTVEDIYAWVEKHPHSVARLAMRGNQGRYSTRRPDFRSGENWQMMFLESPTDRFRIPLRLWKEAVLVHSTRAVDPRMWRDGRDPVVNRLREAETSETFVETLEAELGSPLSDREKKLLAVVWKALS